MRLQNTVTLTLATVGLAVSAYLTYVHYNLGALVCVGGGCDIVQASKYSAIGPVPLAALGMLMFASIIAMVVVRRRFPPYTDVASIAGLCVLLAGVLYYAYLAWLEATVIHAWCMWCVSTALVTVALLVWEGAHTLRSSI